MALLLKKKQPLLVLLRYYFHKHPRTNTKNHRSSGRQSTPRHPAPLIEQRIEIMRLNSALDLGYFIASQIILF